MIEAIDGFLIDKVFQRLTNALENIISCFSLAVLFYLCGLACIVAYTASCIKFLLAFNLYYYGLLAIVMVFVQVWIRLLLKAYDDEKKFSQDIISSMRFDYLPQRIAYLIGIACYFPLDIMFKTSSSTSYYLLSAWIFTTIALYFHSCKNRPVRWRWSFAKA